MKQRQTESKTIIEQLIKLPTYRYCGKFICVSSILGDLTKPGPTKHGQDTVI